MRYEPDGVELSEGETTEAGLAMKNVRRGIHRAILGVGWAGPALAEWSNELEEVEQLRGKVGLEGRGKKRFRRPRKNGCDMSNPPRQRRREKASLKGRPRTLAR